MCTLVNVNGIAHLLLAAFYSAWNLFDRLPLQFDVSNCEALENAENVDKGNPYTTIGIDIATKRAIQNDYCDVAKPEEMETRPRKYIPTEIMKWVSEQGLEYET